MLDVFVRLVYNLILMNPSELSCYKEAYHG